MSEVQVKVDWHSGDPERSRESGVGESQGDGYGSEVRASGNVACDSLATKYPPGLQSVHEEDGTGEHQPKTADDPRSKTKSLDKKIAEQDPRLNPMSKEGIRKRYEEPWNLQRFAGPPGLRSDRWDESLAAYGRYVKIHGKSRKRTLHPIHRSTPVATTSLHAMRVTMAYDETGNRKVLHDE